MISWSTLEFEEKERHPDWLWYAGLVFGIAATLCFFYGNIFFGIFLIVAGVCVIIFAQRPPKTIAITIDDKEVAVDSEHFPYTDIKQFWIDETGKPDKLLLLVRRSMVPMVALPLSGVTADAVRTELKQHISEVEMHESLGVKIAERLGF